ncbi:acyl-CoA dehydrogenase family protein [Streptomyces coeruleorubidus]|uniref:acyl-CoA dehydrogenase family protein n=1 Tax=Streptomyces coeruleorubidus TaxID=116188 RepID=UPI0033A2532F
MTAIGDGTGATGLMKRAIPQPEPGLTAETVIQRACDMRDHLRAEQEATEKRTHYSQETHEKFEQAGFYRMLMPKAFGGYEMRINDFMHVIVEIARGCPSTGWCLSLGSSHVLILAGLYSPEVQAEVVGPDGHFVAPNRHAPSVRAVPHEDGWELDGTWEYSSGAPYSTHAMSAVRLPAGEDGVPRVGLALVPRSQYTVLDDWGSTLGMRGSGSHSIRVKNAVVPSDHVVEIESDQFRLDTTIGMTAHGNPMYTGRIMGVLMSELLAIEIGLVHAALDEYTTVLHEKKPMWNPRTTRAEDPRYQEWYGQVTTTLDVAEAVLDRVGDEYHRLCEREVAGGGEFSQADDLRLMSMAGYGCRILTEAMDLLARTGGSSVMGDGSRLERYWRDMSTCRTHGFALMRETTAVQTGSALLAADGAAKAGER